MLRADIVGRQDTDPTGESKSLLNGGHDALVLMVLLELREHLQQDEEAQQQCHHVTERDHPTGDSGLARRVRVRPPLGCMYRGRCCIDQAACLNSYDEGSSFNGVARCTGGSQVRSRDSTMRGFSPDWIASTPSMMRFLASDSSQVRLQLVRQRQEDEVRRQGPVERGQQCRRHPRSDRRRIIHVRQHRHEADQRADHPESRSVLSHLLEHASTRFVAFDERVQFRTERLFDRFGIGAVDRQMNTVEEKWVPNLFKATLKCENAVTTCRFSQIDQHGDLLGRRWLPMENGLETDSMQREESGQRH